jgi:putative ABC transport system permease protein
VLGAPDVLIVSHDYATGRFGTPGAAVGRELVVNGAPATIAGVMPAGFRFLFDVDVWTPMRKDGPGANARRWHNWLMVGRLKDGVTLKQAQGQVDVISKRLQAEYPDSNRNKALQLDPLQDAIVEGARPRLWVMMGAVGLLLLIACGNVAGLLLARGTGRRTELAMRAALGASRGRLVRQLLTESVLYALTGGALGVALAWWLSQLLPAALDLGPLGIDRIDLGWPVLLVALVTSLGTGALFGVVPAIQTSSTHPARDLAGARTTESRGSARLRSAVVAAQVALSAMLLVASGLFLKTVSSLVHTDPGFPVDHLLTAEIGLPRTRYDAPQARVQFFGSLLDEIRALPGVRAAGMVTALPLRDPGNNIGVWPAGKPPVERTEANIAFTRTVLPGYFEAIGIPLVAGRTIERTDTADRPPVLVINQTMARGLFPDRDPLGQRVAVDMGGSEPVVFEVVGVVGDARLSWIGATPRQAMYHSYYQFPGPATMRIVIRTAADPASLAGSLRTLVWKKDAELPVEALASMTSIIDTSVSPYRTTAMIVTVFSGVALLLAAIGLYGVLTYDVSQRRHEIGVRMALGAQAPGLVRMIVRRGLLLVAIGLAAGVGGALAGGRVVGQLLYGVEPTDAFTYLFAAAMLVAVAAIACLLPAWRAVRVDPVVALRVE